MAVHNFKELIVWKRSVDLAAEVYQAVSVFPQDERFGLTSQIKRAAVSIASNIAEGSGRNSDKEFVHFLGVAKGSAYELLTQLFIADRLGLLRPESTDELMNKVEEVQKMIHGFQEKLKK
ncbi:four helix bundle protein [Parapedobacter soli]|uniref:four helix bundle protein n=1 Tax=Parapedobacter soli TaxID=416955 RepID=UPI0021C8883C|nr:four helix bundle protein [Parapedobacter soli]